MHTIVSKFITHVSALSLALVAFAAATPGHAQTGLLQVDVPFSFESGNNHFAPGVYQIHLDVKKPFISIAGRDSFAYQMIVPDSRTSAAETSKVVFSRYGSRYVLKEVWVAGSKSHIHTPKSKIEKELQLAQANQGKQGSLALLASAR